jgi:hypothetical protein
VIGGSVLLGLVNIRWDGLLPYVSLGTAGLALLLAALVYYLAWDSAASAKRRAEALGATIQELDATVQSMVETLHFPEPPDPRPATGSAPAHPASDVEALKTEVGDFVRYVRDCFVGLGRVPDETGHKIREMERLLAQIGRHTDAAAARAQYKTLGRTLARLTLMATDDDFLKHRKRNPAAEAALMSLLEVAGYSLLTPKPLEKYADGRHVSSSRTERAETRSQRGHIARVERRGLLDSNNHVIEKAEVVLYD